jgi:hypothetical protein
MSAVLSVPQIVARNPVARAVERARLKTWFTAMGLEIHAKPHGEHCESLLVGLAEALAIAIRATDGFDDPSDVRGDLTRAMDHLLAMTKADWAWDSACAGELIEALDVAVQLLIASDPKDRLRAWAVVSRAREETA